jgi:hypothetical protein
MKKLIFASFSALALFTVTAAAEEWKGTISDSGCGKAHADASDKSMACVKTCVEKKGAKPVFVVGDKVLKIDDASVAKVMDHLGHKVVIAGKLNGDTVSVDKVTMQ